jgi:peptide/nickel transport system substrate-binding protein
MPKWKFAGPKALPYSAFVVLLFFGAACGASAPANPAASPTTAPVAPASQATPVPTSVPAGAPAAASAAATGQVTMMVADWGTQAFEPRDATGQIMSQHRMLHGWLIAGTRRSEMIPGIAESWELSPDGLEWTWTIRDGVKFHNGDALTTDDVLFSLDRHHGPDAATNAIHGIFIQQSKQTVSQEKTGPNTIVVTQSQPNATYPFLMSELHSSDAHGAVLPKNYWEEVGGKEGYENAPVGAGPFRLVDFKRSEQMLWERFDDYYFTPENGFPEDRRMKIKTLDERLVPEMATRVSALRAGQADMIEASLEARDQIEAGGGRLIFIPEASYSQVRPMGCWKPELPCHDKRVRYALDYAINKELIRDQLFGGPEVAQLLGFEGVTPSALGYSSDLDALPYDPEKARQLLAEAGYPGGEGFPPFKIFTWDGGDVPLQPQQAELIADMWKENLGLQVTVEVGDTVAIRQRAQNRELDGHVYFRSNEGRFDGGSLMRSATDPENDNRMSEDPALFRAVNEALAVLDPAKRHEAYNKAYRTIWEEHYYWSTVYVNLPWGVSDRIATWEPWPLGPYASALGTLTLK